VLQTLEQVDLTMSTLELADVSLEPVPDGIPPINESMRQVSDDINTTLDSL